MLVNRIKQLFLVQKKTLTKDHYQAITDNFATTSTQKVSHGNERSGNERTLATMVAFPSSSLLAKTSLKM